MVHYIRLLRVPQVSQEQKKGLKVTAVATITTDLGDSFLGQDVELIINLVEAFGDGRTILTRCMPWRDGDRACKVNLQLDQRCHEQLVCLHISIQDTIHAVSNFRIPSIIDVRSEVFQLKDSIRAKDLVERRLLLSSKCVVRQWEETGDSIARHIWDASIGFLMLFQQIYSSDASHQLTLLRAQLRGEPTAKLRILEVGAGCGIVGIALAQLRKAHMVLTDLEDAQKILHVNLSCARPAGGSTIRQQVLEWGSNIDVLAQPVFDLVLVSDCIYNPDSSLLLVETLLQMSSLNPNILILVGFKRRHSADDIFFTRMEAAGFPVAETCEIMLPHEMTEYDDSAPKVEMFVYRATTSTKAILVGTS